MKIPLLMIALGFGYKIFTDATREQASVKTVGRLIGVVMIMVSSSLAALEAAKYTMCELCPKGKVCSYSKSACPIMR